VSILDIRIQAIRLRNHVFGPPYTRNDIDFLRIQANEEEWLDVLDMIQAMPRRQRRWWVDHLLSGKAQVITVPVGDPYDDDDPFECDL
jgi:hypothetical protein